MQRTTILWSNLSNNKKKVKKLLTDSTDDLVKMVLDWICLGTSQLHRHRLQTQKNLMQWLIVYSQYNVPPSLTQPSLLLNHLQNPKILINKKAKKERKKKPDKRKEKLLITYSWSLQTLKIPTFNKNLQSHHRQTQKKAKPRSKIH